MTERDCDIAVFGGPADGLLAHALALAVLEWPLVAAA